MSVFTVILLLVIFYYCAKSIRNIWRDAFNGTTRNTQSRTDKQKAEYAQSTSQQHHSEKPIEKGEGEYVDFTEELMR